MEGYRFAMVGDYAPKRHLHAVLGAGIPEAQDSAADREGEGKSGQDKITTTTVYCSTILRG
jgi:hypothetical protein